MYPLTVAGRVKELKILEFIKNFPTKKSATGLPDYGWKIFKRTFFSEFFFF